MSQVTVLSIDLSQSAESVGTQGTSSDSDKSSSSAFSDVMAQHQDRESGKNMQRSGNNVTKTDEKNSKVESSNQESEHEATANSAVEGKNEASENTTDEMSPDVKASPDNQVDSQTENTDSEPQLEFSVVDTDVEIHNNMAQIDISAEDLLALLSASDKTAASHQDVSIDEQKAVNSVKATKTSYEDQNQAKQGNKVSADDVEGELKSFTPSIKLKSLSQSEQEFTSDSVKNKPLNQVDNLDAIGKKEISKNTSGENIATQLKNSANVENTEQKVLRSDKAQIGQSSNTNLDSERLSNSKISALSDSQTSSIKELRKQGIESNSKLEEKLSNKLVGVESLVVEQRLVSEPGTANEDENGLPTNSENKKVVSSLQSAKVQKENIANLGKVEEQSPSVNFIADQNENLVVPVNQDKVQQDKVQQDKVQQDNQLSQIRSSQAHNVGNKATDSTQPLPQQMGQQSEQQEKSSHDSLNTNVTKLAQQNVELEKNVVIDKPHDKSPINTKTDELATTRPLTYAQEQTVQSILANNNTDSISVQSAKTAINIHNETIAIYRKDFSNAVKEKVMVMINQKIKQLEIRLDPPELGSMQVKLNLQNEQAAVNFVVQNQQAKEALEQNMGKLKEMLADSGVDVGESNIEQQDRQAENDDTLHQESTGSNGVLSGEPEEQITMSGQNLYKASATSVDYYA